MSDKKRLLPCPLCGSLAAVKYRRHNTTEQRAIICTMVRDGCGVSTGWRNNKKDAREIWNTRHYAAFGQAAEPCNMVAEPLDAIGDGYVQDVGP